MDTDSFIFPFTPMKLKISRFEKIQKKFEISDLDTSHEFFQKVRKNILGKLKFETAPYLD